MKDLLELGDIVGLPPLRDPLGDTHGFGSSLLPLLLAAWVLTEPSAPGGRQCKLTECILLLNKCFVTTKDKDQGVT